MCSVNSEIFVSVLFSQIEPSRNHEITLPFTDVCKNHVPYAIFLNSQITLLTLFAKIKFSQKF